MLIKYAEGETPLKNEHKGFVFQSNRQGNSCGIHPKNDRFRRVWQNNLQQALMQSTGYWRDQDSATVAAWEAWTAFLPQSGRRNPAIFLSPYQNWLRRNHYILLNYGIPGPFMTEPELIEILPDTIVPALRVAGGKLYLDYSFTRGGNDLDVSIYASRKNLPGRSYQGTKTRYMCVVGNLPGLQPTFGCLYNWYAISDPRGFAAPGWHVPTYAEWEALFNFLGGRSVAGGILKATGYDWWNSPNTAATNEVGFNLRGLGLRNPISGFFSYMKITNFFMSYDQYSATMQHGSNTNYNGGNITGIYTQKTQGGSARMVRDSTDLAEGESGTYTGNDGKTYPTIVINGQEWQALPSCEQKFQNGDNLTYITANATWAARTSEAYCFYNNLQSNAWTGGQNSIDITERYVRYFGLIPDPGNICMLKALPVGKTNGQFFPLQQFDLTVI